MSEENSLGGILSDEDAVAMLMANSAEDTPNDDAEEVESDEAEDDAEAEFEAEEEGDTDDEDEATDADEGDDTEEDIDADELKKGHMRQADYTRKTQELAAQRQQLEARQQQFDAHAQQQLEALAKAVEAYSIPTEAEPNWPELARTLEPKAYQTRQAEWADKQAKQAQARQIQQRIEEERNEETRTREANLLLERIPEWRDASILKSETAEIIAVAGKFGFTEDDISGLMDHRQIAILRTLAVAERANKAAQQRQATPRKKVVAASGPKKSDPKEKATREVSARLKQTGSVDDAVALLMARGG